MKLVIHSIQNYKRDSMGSRQTGLGISLYSNLWEAASAQSVTNRRINGCEETSPAYFDGVFFLSSFRRCEIWILLVCFCYKRFQKDVESQSGTKALGYWRTWLASSQTPGWRLYEDVSGLLWINVNTHPRF